MTHQTAYMPCGYPGCGAQLVVDVKHLPNLLANGGYDCGAHDLEVTC